MAWALRSSRWPRKPSSRTVGASANEIVGYAHEIKTHALATLGDLLAEMPKERRRETSSHAEQV